MPKNGRDFPCTLNFGVDLATKQKLVAMGYATGGGGEIASPARNMLKRGFDLWYDALSERERKEYREILKNVLITVTK